MAPNAYHTLLRTLPALRDASTVVLTRIATVVDTVELPAGTRLAASEREILLALEPTRVMVIDRRALATVEELAPGLALAVHPTDGADGLRTSVVGAAAPTEHAHAARRDS